MPAATQILSLAERARFYINTLRTPLCKDLVSFDPKPKDVKFRTYREGKTLGTITIVSPEDGEFIHSYYNINPWSPSGRYLAVTRLPFQTREPRHGEKAQVCVIDLHDRMIRAVYSTHAWGFQLGANLHWGNSDKFLYTNDVIDGEAVCVRIDLETLETTAYVGCMTDIAPDESHVLGYPLDLLNKSQRGYGIPDVPGRTPRLPPPGKLVKDNGVWLTDLRTNQKRLLASVADFQASVPNPDLFRDYSFTLFFSKYNKQGTRCMQFLRGVCPRPRNGQKRWIQMAFCHDADGANIHQTVAYGVHRPRDDWQNWKPDWSPGGHHISWTPDGDHMTMNLMPDGKTMRFCLFKHDGSDFRVIGKNIVGSGHPSLDPTSKFLLSDAYPSEPMALENKEVPIRMVDVASETEETVCHIYTLGRTITGGALRCDPHPVWNPNGRQFCFNGAPEGKRQVLIADFPRQS
ncbi:MAG: hypothetical protein SFV32_11835 [Opitutaceae bacterium]|nr:hypothetical protein [Opitutaceae bacterium]